GVGEEEALRRTLSQAGSWQNLRRDIQAARSEENTMTNRVRQFWLPGLLTLSLSMVLLMVIQFIGPKPLVVGTHGWRLMAPLAVIYVPWLLSLLPIGAMGAYLAGRSGASRRTMVLSIVFPVLPYLALFIIAFPVSLILDDHVAHNIMLSALFIGLIAWVLLPGLALLAGGLPVQIFMSRRLGFRGVPSR
ncbi:MAG: hypothetical protein ACHQIK_20890, partial [Candidatus Acidiferrales bacterium]